MANSTLLDSSSVVLVSGGAKGITAQCVIKLAEHSQAKFILLGRSSIDGGEPEWARGCTDNSQLKKRIMDNLQQFGEKTTPLKVQKVFNNIESLRQISETLQAIEQAGGQAEYVCADITNHASLQEKLAGAEQRFGPVTGIIHGAGSLADKLIEKKTEQDFETVYSPKIKGLQNMLKCAPASQLKFLVLFSSIVGFYGNVGQADYAIANEILNKSAHLIKRQHPECHVISMNWGPWDMGMVTPELKKAFEERGMDVISAEAGANLLIDELSPLNGKNVQVIVGSPFSQPAENTGTQLHTHQIRRSLNLQQNPFLYDHVIGGYPVLPATCAAAWAAHTCEQLYPGYKFLYLENYKVLKGIVFDGNQTDEYVMDLKEVSKTLDGEILFDVLVWSQDKNSKPRYHYSLQVKLVRQHPPMPNFPLEVLKNKMITGQSLYQDGTLFHGPSFQGVSQVLHVSKGKLVMECVLPAMTLDDQGQFPVETTNPYIYDAIVQSVLIWAQYVYGAPCLPSGLGKLEQFKPIPFGVPSYVTMQVVTQSETAVRGNILVQDAQGNVYVRITNLHGTISQQLNRFIGVHTTQN